MDKLKKQKKERANRKQDDHFSLIAYFIQSYFIFAVHFSIVYLESLKKHLTIWDWCFVSQSKCNWFSSTTKKLGAEKAINTNMDISVWKVSRDQENEVKWIEWSRRKCALTTPLKDKLPSPFSINILFRVDEIIFDILCIFCNCDVIFLNPSFRVKY